jgi:hypothetical protein
LAYLLFQDSTSPVFAAIAKFAHVPTSVAVELRAQALTALARILRLCVPNESRLALYVALLGLALNLSHHFAGFFPSAMVMCWVGWLHVQRRRC